MARLTKQCVSQSNGRQYSLTPSILTQFYLLGKHIRILQHTRLEGSIMTVT